MQQILHWFRHKDHWSDKSDGPDRFGQYVDKSDRSDSCTMLLLVPGAQCCSVYCWGLSLLLVQVHTVFMCPTWDSCVLIQIQCYSENYWGIFSPCPGTQYCSVHYLGLLSLGPGTVLFLGNPFSWSRYNVVPCTTDEFLYLVQVQC